MGTSNNQVLVEIGTCMKLGIGKNRAVLKNRHWRIEALAKTGLSQKAGIGKTEAHSFRGVDNSSTMTQPQPTSMKNNNERQQREKNNGHWGNTDQLTLAKNN